MKRFGRTWIRTALYSIATTLVSTGVAFAQQPQPFPNGLTEPVFRVSKNEPSIPPTVPHPLDPAIQLAHQSLAFIRGEIKDYTAVLVKRERIGEEISDHEFMFVKIRNRKIHNNQLAVPFSVYLAFAKPAAVKGREVLFVENQNQGKLLAHEGGMKRMLGTHALEPNGYLAMAGQRYPLTDIGLENLVVKLIERGERDKKHGACSVELVPGAKVGGRACSIIQVTHPIQQPHYDFHIAQIFMDDEWKIPVRYAAFSWPKAAGAEPEVIEEYTYQNLKFNVGLTDADFDAKHKDYNFHGK
ncbi:MAG: DUF1571 domain-containing protein [Pirellula sp.]